MHKQSKRKEELPELSVAIKAIRAAYGESQESFAQRVGVSLMTINRYEGGAPPKDFGILIHLAGVATYKRLDAEAQLLRQAAQEVWSVKRTIDDLYGPLIPSPYQIPASGLSAPSPQIWRLLAALRAAGLFRPETLPDLEDALAGVAGQELTMIDSVLRDAGDPKGWNYLELEREVSRRAEQQASAKLLQKRKADQQKK